MPYDQEESEADSKMREKNLINKFWMKDGVDYDELKSEVMKNYEFSFEDPRPQAWRQRSGSRRLRSRGGVNCHDRCSQYAFCATIFFPWMCDFLKKGCKC